MVPFFHVMISYRVSTEAPLARKMFDRLLLNSFKRIPEVGLSQWPDGFSNEKFRPGHANVFLDQVCLKTGESWKHSDEGGGFVGALLKSLIFVPLLSWKVETDKSQDVSNALQMKAFTGSVGEMVARYSGAKPLGAFVDPDPAKRPFCDDVDNVLLELILAMELHAHMKLNHKGAACMHPCLRMFPILVDKFPDFNQLPDLVSDKTYTEASKHLEPFGIHVPVSGKKETVRGVVKFFFEVQAVVFSDLGKEDFALDAVCSQIISSVCGIVSKIDPLSLFESKPLCTELHSFLSKRNCSYMTRILAANSITSLRQLSFLTHQNAIYVLAEQCSSVSSKSAIAELTTLTRMIEESKQDEASWLLSVRLDRFIDKNASFQTVIKSSSGVLISCAQKSWLTIYFLLGLTSLVIGMLSVVSNGPGANTIFDFACSAFFLSVPPASVFHSPKRGYFVFCSMWPAYAVAVIAGFCIDFIKNGSFSIDNAKKCSAVGSQLQTSFFTCAVAQILCGPALLFLMVLVCWYVCFQHQNLAWNTFLILVSIYVTIDIVFEARVLGNSASSLVTALVIVFGAVCTFFLTEWMNARARRKALDSVSKDEARYEEAWDKLREKENEKLELSILNSLTEKRQPGQLNFNTKINLKTFDEALQQSLMNLDTSSVEVLQDCKDIDVLYARAEFINDAFQSLVSILLETGLPAARQNSSSNMSPLKKALAAFFAEVDIEKILQQLKHFDRNETAGPRIPRTKEGDVVTVSPQAAVQHSEPMIQAPPLPGQTTDAVVNIGNDVGAHEDGNKIASQQTSQDNVSVKAAVQSTDGEAKTLPNVWVRRGPVKLPARAIAKVSQNPLQYTPAAPFMLHPIQSKLMFDAQHVRVPAAAALQLLQLLSDACCRATGCTRARWTD